MVYSGILIYMKVDVHNLLVNQMYFSCPCFPYTKTDNNLYKTDFKK